MKQLEQLLRQFIPKFDYFKVFSSQMHTKNRFQSLKIFTKRQLSLKTQFKIKIILMIEIISVYLLNMKQ